LPCLAAVRCASAELHVRRIPVDEPLLPFEPSLRRKVVGRKLHEGVISARVRLNSLLEKFLLSNQCSEKRPSGAKQAAEKEVG